MGFLSQQEISSYLDIQSATSEQQAWMQALSDGISKAIQNHCGRDLAKGTYTENYDGSGRRILKLRQYPIISVNSVTYTDTNGIQTAVVATDYIIYLEEGWLKLKSIAAHSSVWIKGDQDYEIIYDAGYDPLPDDIKLACRKWVANEFQKIEQKLHAVQSRNLGDEVINYQVSEIPADVKKLLERYVRPPYG